MGRLGTGPWIQARSSSHGNQNLLYFIGEKDVWGVKFRHLLGWKGGQVLIAGVVLLALYYTVIAKGITADATASDMNGNTMLEHNDDTSDNTVHASLPRYREDRQIIAGHLVRKSNSKTKPKSNTKATSRSGLIDTEVDTDKTNELPKTRGIVMSCPLGVPSELAGSWKPVNMFRGVGVMAERLYELDSSLPLVVVSFNSELPAHHACLKLKDKHADINSQI
ncbi:hypothetical protein SARC_07605 [Sphaeroforma arctica JP610]|uniref:Uncharacterized protein n=1 Tax=Sphaeroforma arctica JP610 TaxID=667725 RepID=A0A0L0FT77_9EUKA|nr:hypothetical protein SARC_07605 [Sphaeroforma arctica JP610]KNC80010.1 hypothetical protein SARC_07605 [Sphaeroforma arctica JP610]|eukprot:XP_014153912.1 hypothetical protein SARC_07605 [Sphaeroforma arctica JP610]